MARRQGRVVGHVHDRLRVRVVDRRAIASDEMAQRLRADLGDRVGGEHIAEDRGSSPEKRGQQSKQ
jgi:hypothetical protein